MFDCLRVCVILWVIFNFDFLKFIGASSTYEVTSHHSAARSMKSIAAAMAESSIISIRVGR